jgi:hypothetical protein
MPHEACHLRLLVCRTVIKNEGQLRDEYRETWFGKRRIA